MSGAHCSIFSLNLENSSGETVSSESKTMK